MRRWLWLFMLLLWPGLTWGAAAVQGSNSTSNYIDPLNTGVTLTHGFSLQNGDVLYAFVAMGDDSATANAVSSSGGTWTEIVTPVVQNAEHDHTSSILRRVVTNAGGEPSSYTFTFDANAGPDQMTVVVVQVRGADTGTPEDAAATSNFGTNTGTPTNVTIDTTTANALVLIAHVAVSLATQVNSATPGAPSGWSIVRSEINTNASATPNSVSIFVAEDSVPSAGTVTPGAWTTSGGTSPTAWEYATYAVAVRSAAVAADFFSRRRAQ